MGKLFRQKATFLALFLIMATCCNIGHHECTNIFITDNQKRVIHPRKYFNHRTEYDILQQYRYFKEHGFKLATRVILSLIGITSQGFNFFGSTLFNGRSSAGFHLGSVQYSGNYICLH